MTKRYSYDFPRASLTVDCVVFGVDLEAKDLQVLLIQRKDTPFKGSWALPGGFVMVSDAKNQGETLEEAAHRELFEETGIRVAHLEQLYTFAAPGRDPRGRVVSIAHLVLVRSKDHQATAGSDAKQARWWSVRSLPKLAFDHEEILKVADARLRAKITYQPVGFGLLPETFTLTELQTLYEVLLGRDLDKRNFRKRVLRLGVLSSAGVTKSRSGGRLPQLYRFDEVKMKNLEALGFYFDLQSKPKKILGA